MISNGVIFTEKNKRLGRGTIGKVYLVKSGPDDCETIVVRRIQLSSQLPNRRLLQEVLRFDEFKKFRHPHLVHYEAPFIETEFTHIGIVMEFCASTSLYTYVMNHTEEPFSENTIMNWFCQILMAIDYLHGNKTVHGDLRAKNVFLWPNENTCKVSDLRPIVNSGDEVNDEPLYRTGHMSLNAAQHLPPEFWQCGKKSTSECFTAAADMFALGCLLYFLCCRRDAFEGRDFVSISRKVCEHGYSLPPALYSHGVGDMINQLLHSDWRKRPESSALMKMLFLTQPQSILIGNGQQEDLQLNSESTMTTERHSLIGSCSFYLLVIGILAGAAVTLWAFRRCPILF